MKGVRVENKASCSDRSLKAMTEEEAWRQIASTVHIPRKLTAEMLLGLLCRQGACGQLGETAGVIPAWQTLAGKPALQSLVLFRENVRFMGTTLLQPLSYKERVMFLIYFLSNKLRFRYLLCWYSISSPEWVRMSREMLESKCAAPSVSG